MPMADYLCRECGYQFEHWFSTAPDEHCCEREGCAGTADRIYSMPGEWLPTNAAPTKHVIHRGPNGEIRYPGHEHAPVPSGFVREEITGVMNVRKFEREVNQQEYAKFQRLEEKRQMAMEHVERINRADLRGRLKTDAGRELARIAMDKNNDRPRRKFEAGFTVEALSYNRSNRG